MIPPSGAAGSVVPLAHPSKRDFASREIAPQDAVVQFVRPHPEEPAQAGVSRDGPQAPALLGAIAALGALLCALPAYAADAVRGEQLWRKCASCHTLEANGRNRAGPRLHGVIGRAAASVPDYKYSDALKNSGIVWDLNTLDAYIKDAEGFVPGTKMYGGLSQDSDRADLLEFLKNAARR
jgi:cytochrome c